MLVTQVDNYIYTGTREEMNAFETFLQKQFRIGDLDRNAFTVMGCDIARETDGSITMIQKSKIEELSVANLQKHPSRQPKDGVAMPKDLTNFRSEIGKMLFIGRVSHPSMLYHASHMATKTAALQLHHLRDLSSIITREKRTIPKLCFSSRFDSKKPWELVSFSDAALC